jgi:phytoene dehydrogenase-like protein
MEKRTAIVVGSGIGGAAIAALLQHSGNWDVEVYEKNPFPGGRYASQDRDGFRLDVGCHLVANCDKGALAEVLNVLGRADAVKWRYARKPSPAFNFSGKRIRFPRDLGMLGLSPEELEGVMDFYMEMGGIPDDELPTYDNRDMRTFTTSHIDNMTIRNVISLLCGIYFVIGDNQTPVGEWIRDNKDFMNYAAQGYPIGGTGAVPKAYLDCLAEFGGRLALSTGVKRIIVEDGKAVGVELENGEVRRAGIVISNAGSRQTLELVGREHYAPGILENFDKYAYSHSVFTVKVALDTRVTDENMVMYIGKGFETYFDEDPGLLDVPELASHAMIPVFSNLDPTAAPEGRQLLAIAGGVHGRAADFTAEVSARCEEAFMKVLDIVFPGIRSHVLWTDTTSAAEVDALFGKDGCVIGIGQAVGQVGERRPPIFDPCIKNLCHCGADTGLHGIGGELAAGSALRLWNELKG